MALITAQQITEEKIEDGKFLFPVGDYPAIIENSEYGLTKGQDMERLSVEYQIIDGHCKNKKYWEGFNLKNLNKNDPKKQQSEIISWRFFNSLRVALGKSQEMESTKLHNIPFILSLGIRIKKGTVDEKENYVKNYLPYTTNKANNSPQQNNIEPASDRKPPWAQ
jgi:hypothetical protein